MLKDNLGGCWEAACASLMCEMRMYELECLRRRMEDTQAAEMMAGADLSLMSPLSPMSGSSKKSKSSGSGKKKPGSDSAASTAGGAEQAEQFTGISCLLITWKSNPEVEHFKVGLTVFFWLRQELKESQCASVCSLRSVQT